MRYLIIIFLFLQSEVFSQQKVTIHFTYTNSYCGGARPGNEILAKYNTPKKLAGFKLKLTDKKNVFVTTDTSGSFSHKLNPGKYLIFLTEEINKNIFTNYNPACIKMKTASYGELEIEKGKKEYQINLYFPCNPCEPNNKP